jgi:PLP dependent protein
MPDLCDHIAQLRQTIPDAIRLIAVSKYVSASEIRQAYAAGIRDFGENRVQDAMAKRVELQDLTDITWHLIGHLQTNKAKLALEHFDWIHTVDSLALAQKLDRLLAASLAPPLANQRASAQRPQVLLQVKVLPDPNKFGLTMPELWQALPELDQLQYLRVCGLMTILPLGLSPDEQKQAFLQVHTLAEQIRAQSWQNLQIEQLSMGMSGDYPQAMQAGATMIRLGTLLFKPLML